MMDIEMQSNKREARSLLDDLHKVLHDVHHYSLLSRQQATLLLYLFAIGAYFCICTAPLIANTEDQETIEEEYYVNFHMLEFWGASVFTVVESAALVHAQLVTLSCSVPFILLGVNIIITLTTAVLFSIDNERFETTAHWMEYIAQILVTGTNFLFISTSQRSTASSSAFMATLSECKLVEILVVLLLLGNAIVKLLIYGEVIDTGITGEQGGHYCEFVGEMANAGFAFFFTSSVYTNVSTHFTQHTHKWMPNVVHCET